MLNYLDSFYNSNQLIALYVSILFNDNYNHLKLSIMQYHDKQNSLSFQNITQTMKIKRSKKQGLCYYHADKPAKYRDRSNDLLYCTTCAIQEASKGALIEDFTRKNIQAVQFTSFLTEVYEECQTQIQQYIQRYNSNFQRLIQTLTDIQIKDLLCFNKKMQENHFTYQQMKNNCNQNWHRQDLRSVFKSQQHQLIISKINQLNKNINYLKKQGNQVNLKQRLSPKITLKNKPKQLIISNRSLQEMKNKSIQQKTVCSKESSRQSFNVSNNNTNSLKSKNNSTIEQIKKSVYQDTPESIKLRLSDNSFKVTNQMAVTMFQKIDVCQSIDISHKSSNQNGQIQSVESEQGRSSFSSSFKSRYRYKNKDSVDHE